MFIVTVAEKNKILLVSWTLPPAKSGSAFVLQEIIKYFSAEELVVLGEKVEGAAPLPNITYVSSNPIKFKKGNRFIKWYRWLMVPFITRAIIRLNDKEKCTAILCLFPDEIYLESARRAAKKLDLPFYSYFHNTYYENRSGLWKMMAKRIQSKVFQQSEKVYVMSEGMVELYKKIYPHVSFKALVHPFNAPLAKGYKALPANSSPFVITFLGNLNESNIDAFSFFVKTIANREDYVLKIISATPKWFYEKLNVLPSNVVFLPNVSDENLMAELQQSHALFLPHGFKGSFSEVEYQTIFPTRTIQYLFSGVPILGVMPSDCFLYRFLHQHECAALVSEKDESKLFSVLKEMKEKDKCEHLVQNAIKTSEIFVAENVLLELKKDIFN